MLAIRDLYEGAIATEHNLPLMIRDAFCNRH